MTTRREKRPILFSPPMVRAILAGRKTQTRRIMLPQPRHRVFQSSEDGEWVEYDDCIEPGRLIRCPYGRVGDRLWARERARLIATDDGAPFVSGIREGARVRVRYEADGAESDWLPYPTRLGFLRVGQCVANGCYREASRLTLEITGVRVERVQDISEEDAWAEGIQSIRLPLAGADGSTVYAAEWPSPVCGDTARSAFTSLWESINGAESWAANPYVWCISFRRIDRAALNREEG